MPRPSRGEAGGLFKCTKCGHGTGVIDTREYHSGKRRIRKCFNPDCEHKFATYEFAEEIGDPMMLRLEELFRVLDQINDKTGQATKILKGVMNKGNQTEPLTIENQETKL